MFQAAAGMALAARHGTGLAFDLSRYRRNALRAYALESFAIRAELMPVPSGLSARLFRLRTRILGDKGRPPGFSGPIYRELGFRYDPSFAELPDGVLIAGYFQSVRYFESYSREIARAFTLDTLASPSALALAKQLEGENCIALHLRRGDYAADPKAQSIHGVLGWDYYDRGLAHIRQASPDARVYVVSDDPCAAQEGAGRWRNAQVLAGQGAGDDLFLMSRARHHIIANSSFSWWSAWLDRREGGIRVAPKAWFTPEAMRTRPITELVPADWVLL
ncbi:Fut1_Fut2_like domain containing protein [Rhabdaerophilaceae bacterium]